MRRAFWISTVLFFFCANSLAAVLYAGVRALDGGGGFFTLSPFIDCVFWGFLILVCAVLMAVFGSRAKFQTPAVPEALRFPAAYLAMLGGLSVLLLVMGMCRLLDQFSPLHLGVGGYIGLMAAACLACGFLSGRDWGGPLWSGLLWGCALTAAFGLMGGELLRWAAAREIVPMAESGAAGSVFVPMGTESLIRYGPLGWLLGRLDLPACVLMGNYDYAQYQQGNLLYGAPRGLMTMLVCLIPPALFTAGWLAGRVRGLRLCRKKAEQTAGGEKVFPGPN